VRIALLDRLGFGWQLLDALAAVEPASAMTSRIAAGVRAREESFLTAVDEIWQGRRPPYRALLEIAGWDPPRVRGALGEHGLEATLERMARDGVMLDSDEVKGRKAVVRRGRTVEFRDADLASLQGPSVPLVTSGTSGARVIYPIDLAGFRLQASYLPVMLGALAADGQPVVLYYPAASTAGNAHLISFALAGRPPAAWFCHLQQSSSALSQWRLWFRGLVASARLRGVVLPTPQVADVESPRTLVDWLRHRAPGGAVVATFPGSALRVQRWARSVGASLPPVTWILGGEPVSAAKRQRLEEDGHRVYPWYGAVDTGRIAIGCLQPASADDMHLLTDRYAAIMPPQPPPPAPAPADSEGDPAGSSRRLLLTSLIPEVHRRMLNADIGDLAAPLDRRCGCPFERLGLVRHLHAVHSKQKLTVEGATISADAVQSLASDLLPAACGGSPTDYQILEEEDGDGVTRLVVLVHPALAADEGAVLHTVDRVLAVAGGGGTAERLRRSGVVTVRREKPRMSAAGKSQSVARAGRTPG
jgi:hypothetical protein